MTFFKNTFFFLGLFSLQALFASTASDANDLQMAIIEANKETDTTILLTKNISLSDLQNGATSLRALNRDSDFSPIEQTLHIFGKGHSIDGGSTRRGLFISGGNVLIDHLHFQNMKLKGTTPLEGPDGGGAALGGALFIAKGAKATLENVSFTKCNATGGNGGSLSKSLPSEENDLAPQKKFGEGELYSGGSGFGGAIFMQNGSELTIKGSIEFSNNTVTPGESGASETGSGKSGQAAGADIFMMSDSHILFDLAKEVHIPNLIAGDQGSQRQSITTGGITKIGPGSLTLNGNNTYTGLTRVSEGELRIRGSVITPILIDKKGTVRGNLQAKKITNHGVLSPFDEGQGRIHIEGEYKQTPEATLVINITPNGEEKIGIINAKKATIDGDLVLVADRGNYIRGSTYCIVNAPTNDTAFSNVTLQGPYGNKLQVHLKQGSVILVIDNTLLFETHKIDPGPSSEAARAIIEANLVADSDFANVVEVLGVLNDSKLNTALNTLTPVQFGALEWINARNASFIADLLADHMFEQCCSPRNACGCECNRSFWVAGIGNFMNNDTKIDNVNRFEANAGGSIAGVDISASRLYFGASFAYLYTDISWKSHRGDGAASSYYGALYGSYQGDCMKYDFSAIGSGTQFDINRKIKFGGPKQETNSKKINRNARSDPWGHSFSAHLGTQYQWSRNCALFEPFGIVDYHYFHRSEFRETGADSVNLHVRSTMQHMLRGELGLKWSYTWSCDTDCFTPYLGLGWVGDFPLHTSKQEANFRTQAPVMNVTSYDSSIQMVSPQAGAKVTYANGFSALLNYKGLYNSEIQLNELALRFEWVF